MRSDWYTLLSMGMRYWFVAIAAIIVLRAWRATIRDTRRARVLRAWAPDTGAIGEIVVLAGGNAGRIHEAVIVCVQPQVEVKRLGRERHISESVAFGYGSAEHPALCHSSTPPLRLTKLTSCYSCGS